MAASITSIEWAAVPSDSDYPLPVSGDLLPREPIHAGESLWERVAE